METNTLRERSSSVSLMFVAVIGLAVAYSIVFDARWLGYIFAGGVTMKFSTAVCAVLASVMLSVDDSRTRLGIGVFIIVVMISSLVDPLVKSSGTSVMEVAPGVPSLGTVVCFLWIVAGAWVKWMERVAMVYVVSLCMIAVIGHLIGSPPLYYYFHGVSSGMALVTALSLIVIAINLELSPYSGMALVRAQAVSETNEPKHQGVL